MRHLPYLALAAALSLSACSSSSSDDGVVAADPTSAAPSASADGGGGITIRSFAYNDLTVAPGTTISVNNLDSAEHTVTSDTKGLFNADDVVKGTQASFKAPTKPGKYTFHCTYHANMHGTLTVR